MKIRILLKNRNFRKNWNFAQLKTLPKIEIFVKIEILPNWKLCPKSKFSRTMENLSQESKFCSKIKTLVKNRVLDNLVKTRVLHRLIKNRNCIFKIQKLHNSVYSPAYMGSSKTYVHGNGTCAWRYYSNYSRIWKKSRMEFENSKRRRFFRRV